MEVYKSICFPSADSKIIILHTVFRPSGSTFKHCGWKYAC